MQLPTPSISDRLDALSPVEQQIILRDISKQLTINKKFDKVRTLLTSFEFLERKLQLFGPYEIAEDVSYFIQHTDDAYQKSFKALQGALQLSMPVLLARPGELAAQLAGRLATGMDEILQPLVDAAKAIAAANGLLPKTDSLTQGRKQESDLFYLNQGLNKMMLMAGGKRLLVDMGEVITILRLPLSPDSRVMNISTATDCWCLSSDEKYILTGNNEVLERWEISTGFNAGRKTFSDDHIKEVTVSGDYVFLLLRYDLVIVDLHNFEEQFRVEVDVAELILPITAKEILLATVDGCIDKYDLSKGFIKCIAWHGAWKTRRMTNQELLMRLMMGDNVYLNIRDEIKPMNLQSIPGLTDQQRELMEQELQKDVIRDSVKVLARDIDGEPYVISGDESGRLQLIYLREEKAIRKFHGHTGGIICACLSIKAGLLISAARDGSIRVWNTNNGMQQGIRLLGSGATVQSVLFIQDATSILVGFAEGRIEIIQVATFIQAKAVKKNDHLPGHLAHPGKRLHIISPEGIFVWDSKKQVQLSAKDNFEYLSYSHQLTADKRRVISWKKNSVVIWDVVTGWILRSLDVKWELKQDDPINLPYLPREMHVTSDCSQVICYAYQELIPAMTSNLSRLEIWNPDTGERSCVLDDHAGIVTNIAISDDNRILAVSAKKHTGNTDEPLRELSIYDLRTEVCLDRLTDANIHPGALSFDHDMGQLWWRSGKNLRHYDPATKIIKEVAIITEEWSSFLFDRNKIAVAVSKNSIMIWDLSTIQQLCSFTIDSAVKSVVLLKGMIVLNDTNGRLHFLESKWISGAADPDSEQGNTSISTIGLLDTANALFEAGQAGDAIATLYKLAVRQDLSPEFKTCLAGYFQQAGIDQVAERLLLKIIQADNYPENIQLNAISSLQAQSRSKALYLLLPAFDNAFRFNRDNVNVRLIFALLESIIKDRDEEVLNSFLDDPEISPLTKIVLGQAIGRISQPAGEVQLLSLLSGDIDNYSVIVLLDGLRYLIPPDRFLEVIHTVIEQRQWQDDHRNAIEKIILYDLYLGISVMFYQNKGQLDWFETGILNNTFQINNRALTLRAMGFPEEALATFSRGILLFPKNKHLLCNRAGHLIKIRRFKEGIEDATRALELDNRYEKMLNFRGYALMELEQYDLALEDINIALQIKPNDIHNLMNRAHCLTALNRHEEAGRDKEQVKRLKQLKGEQWDSAYETTDRPDNEDERKYPVTGKNKDTAVRLLYKLNGVDRLYEDMRTLADEEDLANFILQDAKEILWLFDDFEENQRLKDALFFPSDLTIEDAIQLLEESSQHTITPDEKLRIEEVVKVLQRVVITDSLSLGSRGEAARALALYLPADEIEKLILQIPDLSKDDKHAPGIAVATALFRSFGNKHNIDRLERIVNEKSYNGWLRELACEMIGAYIDVRKAVGLLNALESGQTHSPGLQRAIARAREHFQLDIAGESEKAPSALIYEEMFNAVVNAESGVEVAVMRSRYPLISDHVFIGHLENYLHQLPEGKEKTSLEKKIQLIKEIPKPIFQQAFDAFGMAKSLEDMKEVAVKYPVLTTLEAQEDLSESIERDLQEGNKSLMYRKLEWLKSIKPDPIQVSVDAFARAGTLAELKQLAIAHPFLRTKKFKQIAEHLIVDGTPNPPMDVRRRWLKELEPDPGDELYDAAWKDLQEGQFENVLYKARQLEEIDPERSISMLKGLAYAQLGEYEMAIPELNLTLQQNGDGTLYAVRGKAFYMTGRMNEAISDFSHAIKLDPGNFEAWFGRANAYSRLNNWVRTRDDMERAMKINPRDSNGAFLLALAYLQTNQKPDALHVLDSFSDWPTDFIPQVESLRQAIDRESGKDPVQEVFYELERATNGNEVLALITNWPEVHDPNFIAALEDLMRQIPNGPYRDNMLEKFAFLLSIVDNPGQKAFNKLMEVKNINGLYELLKDHPITGSDEFAEEIRRMLLTMGDNPMEGEVRRKLEMLEQAKRR